MGRSFRKQAIEHIFQTSRDKNAFDLIESKYKSINKNTLLEELIQVGIMPEVFEHDSSEEKMWSKFSDIMLAKSLKFLGLDSEVLRTRGDSADIFSKSKNYTLVSDAKCFRLSRTAKNQKDFKIKALDDWRKKDTYALLVSPLSQYPADKSQIYKQAISLNVTLLSYVHMQFLIEKGTKGNLEDLWNISTAVKTKYKSEEEIRGLTYWNTVDELVCSITGQSLSQLKDYKQLEIHKTRELGQEGINYWKSKIAEIKKLDRDEAIKLLIRAQKIEQKIETIRKAIQRVPII